jgi:hypothetical protein
MGMPVFAARLNEDGNPERRDQRWQRWQRTRPDYAPVDGWNPGDAMCAVTGIIFDVLDVDPRNGGLDSFTQLSDDLGENGPEVFWEVKTPSGGFHMYIAALGIGSHNGFMPGIDLKGGKQDKTGRGFVFLPPTHRKDGGYRIMRPLLELGDAEPCLALAEYVEERLADKTAGSGEGEGSGAGGGRQDLDEYEREVLAAGPGEQRTALLRLVHELERQGRSRPEMTVSLRAVMLEIHNHDLKNPWYPARGGDKDRWIKTLFHRKGVVVPDATEEEMAGEFHLIRKNQRGLTSSLDSVSDEEVVWIWEQYLGRGIMNLTDGEKGQAKSLIAVEVGGRITRGLAMPNEEQTGASGEPGDVMLFAEDDLPILKKRFQAVGADLSRIHTPDPEWMRAIAEEKRRSEEKRRRGDRSFGNKKDEAFSLLLPNGAPIMARMLSENGSCLGIWDPITDYLDESILTNNDASVRRALNPLVAELQRLGVAGWAFRHMNKDRSKDARLRGGGSMAFQNRARVHMVTGEMPKSYEGPATFGLAMVDANYTKRVEGSLAYSVEDSDVKLDNRGNMVGRVKWHGYVDVSANQLTAGDPKTPGHDPIKHDRIVEIFAEMLGKKEMWAATEATAYIQSILVNEGLGRATDKTIYKARVDANIDSRQKSGGGWEWVPLGKFSPRRRG